MRVDNIDRIWVLALCVIFKITFNFTYQKALLNLTKSDFRFDKKLFVQADKKEKISDFSCIPFYCKKWDN